MGNPYPLTSFNKTKHIAISITEGRTVRDLFYNGLLNKFCDAGVSVTIFTEATTVPAFVQQWERSGVDFAMLLPWKPARGYERAFCMRRRLVRLRSRSLLRAWLAFEQRTIYPALPAYVEEFRRKRPALLLTTHAHPPWEQGLISSAHTLGISTLGLVRSWDNVHKGIYCRPQRLAVWNSVNRQEVIELEGYQPENVYIIGSPQFDSYFAADSHWSRERLAAHFNLDPARPIILFATLGYFIPGFDETCWMDVLLRLIDRGAISDRSQVICRLHPWSRLEHFQRFAGHPAVRLSHVDRYWPSLTWYMTREDVVLMANTLRHADVVITPGSTITLEAAIFDRPTLVPMFHPYQPERAKDYFNTWSLGKHFGRIERLDLVPIIHRIEDFAPTINRALSEPNWYHEQRSRLVRDYVYFTDGRSTERLVELVLRIAHGAKDRE